MFKFYIKVRLAVLTGLVLVLGTQLFFAVNSPMLQTSVALVQSDNNQLLEVRVSPNQVTLETGETVDFTTYGKYATMTIAIETNWLLDDKKLGDLSCEDEASKTCVFTAGDEPGTTTLEVTAENLSDTAEIEVIAEIDNPFGDDIPDWADNSIVDLYEKGIVTGYDDGTYGAGDPLTRSQIVTLLYRVLDGYDLLVDDVWFGKSCDIYPDTDNGHFAYTAICYFYHAGFLEEAEGELYYPNDPAPRGLTSFYVYNVFGDLLMEEQELSEDDFTDVDFPDVPVTHQYYDAIVAMNALGIMTGYDDGNFGPDNELNRAEAAVVLSRVITYTGLE